MPDSPQAIARQLDAAFHARDIEALAALWSDDIDYATPDIALVGKPARTIAEQALLDAFPDARITERGSVGSGDFLVIEGTMSGTHTGPMTLGGITVPPTGRRVSSDYAALLWFREGKLARQRIYFDRLALGQQLGLIPAGEEHA